MQDKKTGIAFQFVAAFDPNNNPIWTDADQALMLARLDERDIPFSDKLADSIAFVKSRIRVH